MADGDGDGRAADAQLPDPRPGVAAVSLKLPPFWPADPELWFSQVEARFSCQHITSQRSKFNHVVASLTPEFAAEVRDLLLRPPEENPFTALKEQLTRRTALSERGRIQQLFTGEELGDRKPSQLLRRMQQLLGGRNIDPSFLRELFLQKLPNQVCMVLASTPDTASLEQLAEMADKIMEVASPTVSALATTPTTPAQNFNPPPQAAKPPPTLASEVDSLRAEVSRLSKQLQQLTHAHHRSPSNNRRPSRRSPTPSSAPPTNTTLCWFHHKFGDQARNCRAPCSWASNEQAGH